MKRSALGPRRPLCRLVALLATGCPGQKPAQAARREGGRGRPKGPLVWKLSKSGLGFRLSNADDDADKESERKVAPSTPLGADDTRKIVGAPPRAEERSRRREGLRDAGQVDPGAASRQDGDRGRSLRPAAPPPASVTPPGPLTVERHAPEGAVDIAPHLTMTFSQPMVAVTTIDDLANKEQLPVALVPAARRQVALARHEDR